MIALILLAVVAVGTIYVWRREACLNAPWVPDDETNKFTQTPLPPPSERNSILQRKLPLRTRGRYIVDSAGDRFQLLSVNWYGASDELFVPGGLEVRHRDDIARTIRRLGFNSVRLPYADELVVRNPVISAELVAANPDLAGLRALDVLEAVVAALTGAGLAVVVNNHITRATWCCGADPCDAGWANDHLGGLCAVRQTEEGWIRNWEEVMGRFRGDPLVVGVDLRNEVRGLWGTMPWRSWAEAAERCADRLLAMNPGWLVVVEGTESANDLSGARARPVRLSVPDRVVYSAHVYAWSGWGSWGGRFAQRRYGSFVKEMRKSWLWMLEEEVAPVWVGELGAGREPSRGAERYWRNLWRLLKTVDADFGYWAVNPRKVANGTVETYSLLEEDWETPVLDYRMKDMVGRIFQLAIRYGILTLPRPAVVLWARSVVAYPTLPTTGIYDSVRISEGTKLVALLRRVYPKVEHGPGVWWPRVVAGVAVADGEAEDRDFVDRCLLEIWQHPLAEHGPLLGLQKLRRLWRSGRTGGRTDEPVPC
ncbi:Glycoside hydrolase, subgroup, catalytic core [Cordyceps fumosorosea ARSEF 2679]|uniref:Glycoside hydrolase, subgroup, catalytic core n=1 Tax=Cordyceps fumosorosea (strain ARSEF 2679) TaxID=1081104 RepID=A0A168E0S5_CORFA|nr:Glycoside hydrolase, subgroup, catalytic core [Cordyceps fumosorosea ARSEF 2679]OAA73240.1 Glycoside hydrolase, subgroup, catalytic core [Cordyceps fumosorosea ARSEF 2679]